MQKNFKDKRSRLFIKGLVVPSMWDDSGNITGISLAAFNEEIYLIVNNEKGKELINCIGKKVEIEVHGRVSEDEKGNLMIDIKSYNLIEDS